MGEGNREVTLREEKKKTGEPTDKALDEVPPFKDRIIGVRETV